VSSAGASEAAMPAADHRSLQTEGVHVVIFRGHTDDSILVGDVPISGDCVSGFQYSHGDRYPVPVDSQEPPVTV
jgi:hypothetical protein